MTEMFTAVILAILIVTPASVGAAMLLRAWPWTTLWQAHLERTWTAGKPLNCWTCLVGWCSILIVAAVWTWDVRHGIVVVLASTGIGGSIMQRILPIPPTFLPPVEGELDA